MDGSGVLVFLKNGRVSQKLIFCESGGRLVVLDLTVSYKVFRLVSGYAPFSHREKTEYFRDLGKHLVSSWPLVIQGDLTQSTICEQIILAKIGIGILNFASVIYVGTFSS